MNQRLCAAVLGAGLACAAQAQQLPANVRCVRNGAPAGGDGRSWAAAWPELQEALLTAAASGGQITEVLVAQGEYTPPQWNRCVGFRVSNVSLFGGFAGVESSTGERPAGSRSVLEGMVMDGCTQTALLDISTSTPVTIDGFELHHPRTTAIRVGGPATLIHMDFDTSTWRGITKTTAAAPLLIRECRFRAMLSTSGTPISLNGPGLIVDSELTGGDSFGTGMLLSNLTVERSHVIGAGDVTGLSAADVVFRDCTVHGSGLSRAVSATNCDFDGCVLTGWTSHGGAIDLTGGSVRRTRIETSGGAMPSAQLSIFGTTLNDNDLMLSGSGYLMWHGGGTGVVVNCRITGSGGPVSASAWAAPRFIGCSFAHTAYPMFQLSQFWRFENCIIWGSGTDDASTFNAPAGVTGFVNYCDVRGWSGALGGVGNISVDPLLNTDGTLRWGSPCIDAGDNARVPPGAVYDFVRGCRIVDGDANGSRVVDMGPHEFTLCAANCDCSTGAPVLNVLDFNCFLHRFSVGDPWANCDRSTEAPVLNVLDFNCFVQRFTAGCP
jgi:hypothetical protein